MIKRIVEFVRRNLVLILFMGLIGGQLLTWRSLASIQENVDHYACGTYSHPCRVIIVPDR